MQHSTFLSIVLASALALGACKSSSFGHRSTNCDPDERLTGLLHAYQDCKTGDCEGDESDHVLVDCERVPQELEKLAAEFPRHVPTLMANAAINFENRQTLKAERFLDSLFSIEASHPEAAMLRCQIAIEAGNYSFAARMLERQIELRPDHAGLRETHSALLYTQRQYDAAKGELAIAEALGAPPWRIAFNRGLIAEALDATAEAEVLYQKAVDANPGFQPARSRLTGVRAERGYNASSPPPGEPGGK